MKTITFTPTRLLAPAIFLSALGIWLMWQLAGPEAGLSNKLQSEMPLEADSQVAKRRAIGNDESLALQAAPVKAPSAERVISSPAGASIDVKSIQEALQRVELDDAGNVVLDHGALKTLYDTLGYGGFRLSDVQLARVQDIVRQGLPGKAGRQAAETVGNFYHYLEAKKQVDQMYEHSDSAAEQRFKVEDLRSLRRVAFGVDQAELLFSRQEAHEDYMLANMAVSLDETLSEQEREQRRENLKHEILKTDYGIVNWATRHDSFLQQKNAILDTSLSATEKTAQLDALFARQFTADEAGRIEHLNLTEF